MLIGMPTTQIAIRVPDDLLSAVDRLVEAGFVDSRADAVRRGLEHQVAAARRAEIDAAIVEGYRNQPITAAEETLAEAALRASILEEPW